MKRTFAIILLLWSSAVNAQDVKMYTWEEALNANPDSVFGITFEKMKLTEVPEKLAQFKKLRFLNLSKNKIEQVPNFIGDFSELEVLNVERNKLTIFPLVVCRLTKLKELIVNRNEITEIPECIEYAVSLEYIDIYDNPVGGLPESLARLKNLKNIDITGIRYSPKFQEQWIKTLPNVELIFDAPCDCMN
jgi:hypothetical protein